MALTMLDLTQERHAYLFGLLQTDGCHSGDPDHRGKVTLEMKIEDAGIFPALRDLIPCHVGLSTRTRVTDFSAGDYQTAVLSVSNQTFRRELQSLGLPPGKKSYVAAPPSTTIHTAGYVRGLLDGDGSVGFTATNTPFISFVTASDALAEFMIKMFWEEGGARRTARRNRRDGVFNLMVTNVAAARLAGFAYPHGTDLAIPRKLEAARKVASWRTDPAKAGRYGVLRRRWTAEDDAYLLSHTLEQASRHLDRTMSSVSVRKWRLISADRES